MSETLWYYRSNVQRITEILRKRLIFQRDGKIASFTSNTLGWCRRRNVGGTSRFNRSRTNGISCNTPVAT